MIIIYTKQPQIYSKSIKSMLNILCIKPILTKVIKYKINNLIIFTETKTT